jgi:hypothetical protein
MKTEKVNEHPAITFLKSLYSSCNGEFIHFLLIDRAGFAINKFVSIEKIDPIPTILKNYRGYNVYFGVATRLNGDMTKEGIIEIPCLWIDIDLTDKNGVDIPEDKKREILQRPKDFPLKPSYLINSGGGIHAYWILKSPFSKEEIPLAENLNKRLASYFGGDKSSTDANHKLRIPGTLNLKPKYKTPRKVTIEEAHPENEYSPDDFEAYLPQAGEPYHSEERQYHQEKNERLNQIMECEFLKHCDCNRATLSEPEWYAMISLLARETGGPNLIHGLSRGYPRYQPGETDKKILHALNDTGPATCERIKRELFDCGKDCGVASPAVLGFKAKQDESKKHWSLPSESKENSKGINYHLTTLNDVFEYPEPTFIIDQILVEGTVNVFGAYTGAGKSIITLSIIKSVLTGQPLWRKYPVLKTGPVLLVDEETPSGFLRERVEKMGFDKSLPLYFLHFQEVRLDRDDCFNALMEKIGEVKPVLVVIDSLIRVHRQKEDDATSMALVVGRLRKIVNSGTTLWTIHHHKKGEGPLSQKLRGSSDIPGGVDIEYALVPKDDYLIFSSVKTRTKPLAPIRLKLDVSETEIRLTYEGTEAEEVLTEVTDVLNNKGRLGVNEIWEELKARDYEIGINRLREFLRDAIGKEIQGEKEKGRGKRWVFWVNDSSRFTPIYNTVKSEGTNQDSVDSSQQPKKEEISCEETNQHFQGLNDSSRVDKEAHRKKLRNKKEREGLYKVMDDGQFTY